MSVFVDTNVLIYAAQLDTNAAKMRRATELLERDDLVLSTQCLNEFVFQSTRVSRAIRLTLEQALAFAETLQRFPVISVDLALFAKASEIARLTRYRCGTRSSSPPRSPQVAKRSRPRTSSTAA